MTTDPTEDPTYEARKIETKITTLIASGAIQLSRKYRLVGLPPALNGGTFLDLLRDCDPYEWARLEEIAKERVIRLSRTQTELTLEEFDEWLKQHGRSPLRGGQHGQVK